MLRRGWTAKFCFSAARDDLSMWRGCSSLAHGGQSVAIGFHAAGLKLLASAYKFDGPQKLIYGYGRHESSMKDSCDIGAGFNSHALKMLQIQKFAKIEKLDYFGAEAECRMLSDGHFSGPPFSTAI